MSDYRIPVLDAAGSQTGTRPATDAEVDQINPTEAQLRRLTEAVDQLILDALLGGS